MAAAGGALPLLSNGGEDGRRVHTHINTALQLYALGDMFSAATRGHALQYFQGQPNELCEQALANSDMAPAEVA